MIFSTSPESSRASCALVEPVDLVSLIQALFDSFRVLADAKRIGLDAELDRTVPSTSGDPERLRQIFTNLFSNAVKFTPAGGNIPIKLERVGSDIKVSVSDTGQGISPDFLSYVFDRFRQAESSTTRALQLLPDSFRRLISVDSPICFRQPDIAVSVEYQQKHS